MHFLNLSFIIISIGRDMNIKQIYFDGNEFLKNLFDHVIENVNLNKIEIDHLCYRVNSNDIYYKYKEKLKKIGELISDEIISGREISTFKLIKPFEYKDIKVYLLELPSVKEGSFYKEGFEHFEMVIDESFKDFMDDNSQLEFITKDINKTINADVQVKFSKGKVKFHHQSLEEVIKLERIQNS
jgi:predicted metalloenzyme YecM